MEDIQKKLFQLQDVKYRAFQSKLIPTVDPEKIIGVRTPDVKRLSKEMYNRPEISVFLNALPHTYFDENQLHAFILNEHKEFKPCVESVCRFLPYIDNWATCDQLSPKCFKRHAHELLDYIQNWINDKHVYTIRFGIGMLMRYFLDDDFDLSYPEQVSRIKSDEYYVNMMIAWYYATALAKQYDAIIPFFETPKLDTWVRRKAIQKAVESYRISDECKQYLKQLK